MKRFRTTVTFSSVDADGYFFITDRKKDIIGRKLKRSFVPKEMVILPALPGSLAGNILIKN